MYPTAGHNNSLDQPQQRAQSMAVAMNSNGELENIELNDHGSTQQQLTKINNVRLDMPSTQTIKLEGSVDGMGRKRSKRKVIRRIIRKRTSDGSFVPVEVTKTVIDRDGSKSITRLDPVKYVKREGSNFDGNE